MRRVHAKDLSEHGWLYWHLPHQFPGVWVCPWHGRPLLTSKLKSTGVERFQWHLPDASSLEDMALQAEGVPELARLAALIIGLIEHPAPDGWLDVDCQSETRAGSWRSAAMSRIGGAPNWRLYSRLNCEALS